MSEDDKESRPLDLGAWEPQEPPADFADRVMAELESSSKNESTKNEVVPLVPRRRRWPFVAGGLALAAAVLVGIGFHASPPSQGELITKERVEVRIGTRGLAVLEPGAKVQWNGDDVVQSQGDVFYRVEPGARFTVHTPAGDVEVRGTCFSIKVHEMNKRDLKVAAGSTILSALAFVAVYEGKVAVSHASERVELTAGQTAQSGNGTVRLTNGESPADIELALANANSNGDDDPQVAANRNLVHQIGEYRHRLESLESEKTELKTKLAKSENALSASKDGAPAVVKPEFDVTPEDWKEFAKDGTIKYQNPCIDLKGGWTPSPEKLNQLGLSPDDAAPIKNAYKASSERLWATIKPLCVAAVGGNEDIATRIGPDTCVFIVSDMEKERDPEGVMKTRKLIGQIRAGEAPMPAPNAAMSPVMKLFLSLTGESKNFENDLAQTFGPEEARRLTYADGMCMHHSVWGSGSKK